MLAKKLLLLFLMTKQSLDTYILLDILASPKGESK